MARKSAELLIYEPPKKYFESPKNTFRKAKLLKIHSQKTIHLAKVKHDVIIMKNCAYLSPVE